MTNIRKMLADFKRQVLTKRMLRYDRAGKTEKLAQMRLSDLELLRKKNAQAYCRIKDAVEQLATKRLHEKERIKVAFVLYSASMWSCADLYRMLHDDERFEPYVVVAKYTKESNKQTWPTFVQSCAYFEREGYKLLTVPDDTPANKGWQAMGEPDIVFYLTPYHTLLPVGINQGYLPGKALTVYIPYSYMLIQAEQKYDLPAFRCSWRHFCDSETYRQILLKYDALYDRNTRFVGYPKMDVFFKQSEADEKEFWKSPEGKKKIIYAPHHSLKDLDYCSSHFSTFDKNGEFMLELAKKYADTTTWVYKPHPNLKMTAVMAGVYENEQAYEQYLAQWDALPNAKTVMEGTYAELFKSSDAMICDSVSFLAEYQFTQKPLLLLTRPEQAFNAFGEQVQRVLYKCPGEELDGIEEFLRRTVLEREDSMRAEREQFFAENLDYYHKNGNLSASEQIFRELCAVCFG